MFHYVSVLFKILLASLMAGAALSFFGVTLETIFGLIGQTPDSMLDLGRRFIAWAAPNVLLGAFIVLPVWLVTWIFLPPRDY
ncbi:DUF6460 domain-containing protein [Ciceribacter sp. L1K23]|uniref:DUF6460 domain-containing protein n=1 Tax=Ciceribacter sp. L1K23 TaxID=2820276 RepID=UPI0032C21E81